MSVRVGTLRINMAVDLKAFDKGLLRGERALNRTAKRFTSVGKSLTTGLTLPIIAAGAAVTKFATDFDTSLSRIEGLVGRSREEVAGYRKEILALAGPTAKAPKELADAMFFITSAGFEGAEAVDTLRAAAKASAAGLGDTIIVADAVTSAVNAYGKENLSAAISTSILVAAVREGKASAETIAPALGAILPIASELGVSFDQVAASIAAMTRIGFDAAESGTALRATLTTLLKPSKQAEDALRGIGLSFEDLRRQLREKGLLSVLNTLKAEFKGNSAALTKIFPNVRALSGVLALVGKNGESTRKIFAKLAQTTTKDLNDAFAAAQRDGGFRLQQAIVELQVVAVKLGDALKGTIIPAVKGLTSILRSASEMITNSSKGTKDFVIVLLLAAAAIGPLSLVIGFLFAKLATGLAILRNTVALFSLLGGVLSGPVIIAAAVVATAAVIIFNRWEELRFAMETIFFAIANSIRDLFQNKMFSFIKKGFAKVLDLMARFGVDLRSKFGPALEAGQAEILKFTRGAKTKFAGLKDSVLVKMGEMSTELLAILQEHFPQLVAVIGTATDAIEGLKDGAEVASTDIPTFFQRIGAAITNIAASIKGDLDRIKAGFSSTASSINSTIDGMRDKTLTSMGATAAAFAKGEIGFRQFATSMIKQLVLLIAKILLFRAVSSIFGGPFAGGFVSGIFGGSRATGGPVQAGKIFRVNEREDEFFIPSTGGQVVPLSDMEFGGGGGNTTKISISLSGMDFGSRSAGRKLTRSILSAIKDNSPEGKMLSRTMDVRSAQNKRSAM